MLSYYEVCEKLKEGWTYEWNEEQAVPYAYSINEWVGYDNAESLKAKVVFLR